MHHHQRHFGVKTKVHTKKICMKIAAAPNYKMSTGKRLAKRSIVGTRVCAPGGDNFWYCGVIQKVKTPPSGRGDNNNCITLTSDTKYTVRFDIGQTMVGMKEYLGSQLIGPGFQNVLNVILSPGQRIFITYNGRESAAEVITHDNVKDEVSVRIPANGLLEVSRKRMQSIKNKIFFHFFFQPKIFFYHFCFVFEHVLSRRVECTGAYAMYNCTK